MEYPLVILDFDGTIADTRKTILKTFQMSMERLGLPIRSDSECAATIGMTLENGYRAMFPTFPEERILECAAMYRRIFEDNKKDLTPQMFPGVKETLEALHADGHVLTIASSRHSASIQDFLEGFGILGQFRYILGAGDVLKSKPDPEPVLKTLSELHFPVSEALVVGDMPFDVLMGKRAGAAACGVTYGNSSRQELLASGADFVIGSFQELLSIA